MILLEEDYNWLVTCDYCGNTLQGNDHKNQTILLARSQNWRLRRKARCPNCQPKLQMKLNDAPARPRGRPRRI
jgi:hypothetical protein